jgi:prolyl-tRNA editing enzyme YbaK/EbsC (Cys-tRNA(Pro) deacylase)
MKIRALAAMMAAVAIAGCAAHGTSTTAAKSAPVSGTQAANTLVCQHYLKQRAWVKGLTYPTLGDALKFEGYVAADSAEASGKLGRDLGKMLKSMQAKQGDHAASAVVYYDCTR